jgi:hypothetical protein
MSTNRKENLMKKLTISGLALVLLLVSGTAVGSADPDYTSAHRAAAGIDVKDGPSNTTIDSAHRFSPGTTSGSSR